MTEALEPADRQKLVRDLLLPGIVEAALTLGLRKDVADLVWVADVLKLRITDDGRTLVRPIATLAEVEDSSYKEQFVPRVNAAFEDFLRAGGVIGAGRFLERRGPRQPPGAADEEVMA